MQISKGVEGIEEERKYEGTEDNEDMIKIEELNEMLKHAKKEEMLWIRLLTNGIVEIWRKRNINKHIRTF